MWLRTNNGGSCLSIMYKHFTIFIVAGILTLASGFSLAAENKALSGKHKKIIKAFPSVQHVSADELGKMQADDIVVFDVREPEEYNVSHIEGAILVAPKISAEDFIATYGEMVEDKTVVLYCSVGHRSSVLAEKVQTQLTAASSGAVYNLEGGLFKWHNESMPLVTTNAEPTEYIHPYNFYWGRMVNQKSKRRYQPDTQ